MCGMKIIAETVLMKVGREQLTHWKFKLGWSTKHLKENNDNQGEGATAFEIHTSAMTKQSQTVW